MVSFKTLAGAAGAALAGLPSASAYIYNMTAPSTAVAGSKVVATLETAIYIQNWDDYAIIWGIAPESINCGEDICIGQQIDYTPLYPNSPELGNFSVEVTIPAKLAEGDYQLVAAVPYTVGASGLTAIHAFNSSIIITAA
ncbi:hypothetical protein BJ170DRAFT_623648 [Xylariales sp. AK1849]|nr:hypothetical protein BJ170DRAFT_623648 [Xylariales sp. AK1849]